MSDDSAVLVVGLGLAGAAVCRALARRNIASVVTEDHPRDTHRTTAESIGVELIERPSVATLEALVGRVDSVVPSPGVPDHHPVFAAASRAGVLVQSEFDLAAEWDDRPVAAITGTDGKTTVTTMVTLMLEASGVRVAAAGNTDLPFVAAIDDATIDQFVIEASSFRLAHCHRFAPDVATWLNFGPDHQDAHHSMESYELAKSQIWARRGDPGTAIGNADDAVVSRHLPADNSLTFSINQPPAAGRAGISAGALIDARGDNVVTVSDLPRQLPHDLANALAASLSAQAAGATSTAIAEVLTTFEGLDHRVQLVGTVGGIRWYDDSKATTPHATLAAIGGFDSAVLIAGGRNKGLDLSVLAEGANHLAGVVAIGEAAPEISATFAGLVPTVTASNMNEAVAAAGQLAGSVDTADPVVLLSPACASFDWYGSYAERGDDFHRIVLARGPAS